jgi:hypothetical protein
LRHLAMSASWSLTGGKRTSSGHIWSRLTDFVEKGGSCDADVTVIQSV